MLQNIHADNIEITQIVAKSISKLASSSGPNFLIDDQRQRIMEGIFDLLKIADCQIMSSTLEALITLVDVNFQHMQPYQERIMQAT